MPLRRIGALLGAALMTRAGRRVAGRHGGKIAVATAAFQLWQAWKAHKAGAPQAAPRGAAASGPRPAPRSRWSGRRPR